MEEKNQLMEKDSQPTKFRNNIRKGMQKNLIGAALFEILIGVFVFAFPLVLLEALNGMEILYPIISIPEIPQFRAIGLTYMIIAFLQIIYSILMPKIDETKGGQICGLIIGIGMLIIPPTGTYFGILLIQYLWLQRKNKNESDSLLESEVITSKHIQNSLISSGILMLHQPIILLLMQFWIITLPIDMAYPFMSTNTTRAWETISWIIFALFGIQILVGIIYPKISNQKIGKILGKLCVAILFLSLGLFFEVFIGYLIPALDLGQIFYALLLIVWLLGVLFNPLGIYFAIALKKELNSIEKKN